MYKLDYYGIRGSTHNWITSWLSERSQKVVLDGQSSDPVAVLSDVPQGSVLGPKISGHLFAFLLTIVRAFGILPMVLLEILPTVPLVANGTIGNQRTVNVSRQPVVPLVPMLPLVEALVPMVPLVVHMVATVI